MNKKLIKSIASITCGLGIVSSIPFASTSCGSSYTNILPTKLLKIDENGVLEGFVSTFNPNNYQNKRYDTIKVPKNVTGVSASAFDYRYDPDACPTYIKKIDFSGCSNLVFLSYCCFRDFKSITSIDFSECTNLSTVYSGYCFEGTDIETLDFSETNFTKFDSELDQGQGVDFTNFLYGAGRLLHSLILPGCLQTISTNVFLNAYLSVIY
ncbi:MAG: leucine-rich repeat domain-containing protein [Mycoplasmoidaceae bacterium]|nr:leucine-rich repeat domain-containing protein [Mycoplasmoidaceae bacterium]